MDISTNNMKLNLNKAKVVEKEEKWIEQDIIVPDNMPDAIKIVSVNATPYINDVEVSNNRAKIVGKINYSVIYIANEDDMNIRGLNVSYPYTTNIECNKIKNKDDVIIKSNLKNIIYSLPNERKVAVKNEVAFNIDIMESVQIDIIKDFNKCDDIECKKENCTFCDVKEKKKIMIASTEDVMLPKENSAVYEILKVCPKIKDTEYKVSYNKIMVKGIIELNILYVGENKSICNTKVDVPFSSMVESNCITDKAEYKIDYCIRDLNVRINPDIDQKTLNVDFKIECFFEIFEKEEVEYIKDFYSRTRELQYDVNDVDIITNNNVVEKEINITESLSDIIPENYRLIEYSLDTSNVLPKLNDNTISINGIAKLNIISQNKENGEIDSKQIDLMVDKTFDIEPSWRESNINISIKDIRLNVIQNGNSIDIKVTIFVDIEVENLVHISSINKIEDAPLNLSQISSINIYVVKEGDSIWKIAKKYKTSMDNIIKTNNIENPNLINIGQKLLVIR